MIPLAVVRGDKPAGATAHRTDTLKPGYCEWLEHKLQQKLFIVHRLDKETTGAMVFGADKESAAKLTALFTERKVKKTYLLITDKEPREKSWTQKSRIEQDNKNYVSHADGKPNSETRFTLLNSHNNFYLLRAEPLTGKTHQIRLHARDAGIPLLGDSLYGGTRFPTFFLHCLKMESELFTHESLAPLVYEQLHILEDPLLCQWLMSYDRRQRLYPELLADPDQCLRLVHNEGTALRIDRLGTCLHAGWWDDKAPTEGQISALKNFFEMIGVQQWSLQHYGKQGAQKIDSPAPESWLAKEGQAVYQFKSNQGLSPGLFLDQRNHREWVRRNSSGKNVLNLFAYTGGFSVCAALGGATQVTTVDLSPKYVEWSRENFAHNNLPLEGHKFHAMDSQEFLKYAAKKQLRYDIIVCDPPSYSRNKNKDFRIDRDYSELLEAAAAVLQPGGSLLFSTNFEKWDMDHWVKKLTPMSAKLGLQIEINYNWQWDFESSPLKSHMKAFHLR